MLELISETNYRETMENTVEPKLASIREELSLPLEDGGALHAELYEQPTATRTIIDLMTGTDGYTISSGICPSYLRGDDIISIPLEVEEIIRIGVITHKDYRPTALGQMYLDILHRVVGDMQGE